MRKLLFSMILLICTPTFAEVKLIQIEHEPISLEDVAIPVISSLNAAPSQGQSFDVGLILMIDAVKYYIKPTMFMVKSKPDEICTPTGDVLAYQCKEGQRFVKSCNLLFFDSQGKWVGWHTLKINEKYSPHYCNAMPAMGVANKEKNELLVTMQYFLIDNGGAKKASEIGSDWLRMTTLFRVNASNGKVKIEQDSSCLSNPNQLDTIAKARKQLQRCAIGQK